MLSRDKIIFADILYAFPPFKIWYFFFFVVVVVLDSLWRDGNTDSVESLGNVVAQSINYPAQWDKGISNTHSSKWISPPKYEADLKIIPFYHKSFWGEGLGLVFEVLGLRFFYLAL